MSDTSVYWHALIPKCGESSYSHRKCNETLSLTATTTVAPEPAQTSTEDNHDYYLKIVSDGEYDENVVDMTAAKDFSHLTGMEISSDNHQFPTDKPFKFYGHFVDKVK